MLKLLTLFLFLTTQTSYAQAQTQAQAQADVPDVVNSKEILKTVTENLGTDSVNADVLTREQINNYRQQLRQVKQQSGQKIVRFRDAIDSEKGLLEALGKAPEEGKSEDEAIAAQRQNLENTIKGLEGDLKQARLNNAKAEELAQQLSQIEQDRLKTKLLNRIPSPFLPAQLERSTAEAFLYARNFDGWLRGGIFVLFVTGICWLMMPATKVLNQQIKKSPSLDAEPILKQTLIQLVVASAVVLIFRFNLLAPAAVERNYINLENLLQAIASIWLALMLFRILGKIRVMPKTATDVYGSKLKSYAWLWNGLRRLVRLVVALIPITAIAGFVELSAYLALNLFATVFGLMLFAFLRAIAVRLSKRITDKSAEEVANTEEKSDKEALSPLAISILEPFFAIVVLGFILFFWGMNTDDVEGWVEKYRNGIPIGNITLNFSDMGAAISAFAVLFGFTKVLQWFLGSRVLPYTQLDAGIKNAALTVIGYIGGIAALLSAFGALGLSMENFAIVAGALSVGIGFGLQAIFSNFVSGLILLFERPVKVGDMIIVGGEQGIIKKIRVRSTEIETFHNANIIVPNSQLISETVTNWTLHNRVGRVDVQVGVAYGSDTALVSEVLLKVASKHSSVRKYPASQVFFMDFGDSSLNFELRCFITNIRDVFRVKSELRFEIDKAFREHNIEIPFPQRDLHVRSGLEDFKPKSDAAPDAANDQEAA